MVIIVIFADLPILWFLCNLQGQKCLVHVAWFFKVSQCKRGHCHIATWCALKWNTCGLCFWSFRCPKAIGKHTEPLWSHFCSGQSNYLTRTLSQRTLYAPQAFGQRTFLCSLLFLHYHVVPFLFLKNSMRMSTGDFNRQSLKIFTSLGKWTEFFVHAGQPDEIFSFSLQCEKA